LGFAAEPIPIVRVGFVGIGMRGSAAIQRFTHLQGVEVKGLCDLVQENIDKCQKMLTDAGMAAADGYTGEEDYKKLCERDDIDLIYVATDCTNHVKVALYAMEHGKHVAVEVPGAITLDECWALVDTSERTRRHCMMLENCVYDFFELTTMNMAHQGVFGEIVHAEGAYIHNLEPYWEGSYKNWRIKFNQSHRGDLYPTHGFGPICMALNMHRGNKMTYLVSIDTKSVNGLEVGKKLLGVDEFLNGDHTTTFIKTELGQTIDLQYDVYSPRPYDHRYQLTGTKGFASKYPISGYTFTEGMLKEGVVPEGATVNPHGFASQEIMAAAMDAYKHPIHQEIEEVAKKVGGHGGMDFVMDYRLIYCLQNGLPLDQDVYDAAEWSCITHLSSVSLKHNSVPVAIPDFTRGDWNKLDGVTFHMK
jgi:predicted dehydrogenase